MLAERAVTPVDRNTALSRFPVPALAPLLSAAFAIGQPLLASLMGITRWSESESSWGLGLTLVVLYTAAAVPAGVLLARRLVGRPIKARPSEFVTSIAPAALGTLLATPVVVVLALPARVAGNSYPGISAGLSVPLGAALGVLVAVAALASPSVARGLTGALAWVWASGFLAAVLLLGVDTPGTQPPGAPAIVLNGMGTAQDLVRGAGLVLGIAGPALVAAWATVRSLRAGASRVVAVAGAASGSLVIVAAYRAHPAVLEGDVRVWYTFALAQLLAAVLAAGVAVVFVRARRTDPPPRPSPR